MLGAVLVTTPTLVACPSPAETWGIEDALVVRLAPGEARHVTVELNDWATHQAGSFVVDVRSYTSNAPIEVVLDDARLDALAYRGSGRMLRLGAAPGEDACPPSVPCRIGLTVLIGPDVELPVDVRIFAGANRPLEGCGYDQSSPAFDPRAEVVIVED